MTMSYMYFNQQRCVALIEENPSMQPKMVELTKIVAAEWNAMDDEAKKPFVELAEEDKIRYAKQMKAYVPLPKLRVVTKRKRVAAPAPDPAEEGGDTAGSGDAAAAAVEAPKQPVEEPVEEPVSARTFSVWGRGRDVLGPSDLEEGCVAAREQRGRRGGAEGGERPFEAPRQVPAAAGAAGCGGGSRERRGGSEPADARALHVVCAGAERVEGPGREEAGCQGQGQERRQQESRRHEAQGRQQVGLRQERQGGETGPPPRCCPGSHAHLRQGKQACKGGRRRRAEWGTCVAGLGGRHVAVHRRRTTRARGVTLG